MGLNSYSFSMLGYRMSKAGVCCLRAQQEISEEAGVSEPDSRIPPSPGKFFSISLCLLREDVYHVVKAFAMIGEWVNAEAKLYTQVLMRDFEHNGLNLTLTKREEMQRVRVQIDELSLRYIQNLHEDFSFLVFTKTELAISLHCHFRYNSLYLYFVLISWLLGGTNDVVKSLTKAVYTQMGQE